MSFDEIITFTYFFKFYVLTNIQQKYLQVLLLSENKNHLMQTFTTVIKFIVRKSVVANDRKR